MSITGKTNTCIITANTPFIQSGVTSGSATSITITDENGMSVTNCFGLTTEVSEFSSTGETCNNVLEIVITEGVEDELICDYVATSLESTGLVLLTYIDNSTSLNVHPECCELINSSYTSEIGDDGYYVCRWREMFDSTDCNNYTPTNTFDANDYAIFDISTGGTTTIIPSAQCCYINGLVDDLTTEGVKCKEPVIPVCADYVVEANIPEFGDVEFTVLSTGLTSLVVPTLECCTVNGLSGREVTGGYTCYNALNPPTVQITLDSDCCEGTNGGTNEGTGGGTVTTNYNLSRATSTTPSCDGFVASTFPLPVKNYNNMGVGSEVTYENGLPFVGTGQWYYYLSADSISTTSKEGVRINSIGIITEKEGCYAPE